MVGREIHDRTYVEDAVYDSQPVGLELQNVSIRDPKENVFRIKNVSFQVHKGEILGIAGVSGNGQSSLCDAISGYRRLTEGKILLNGQDITASSRAGTDRAWGSATFPPTAIATG